MLGKDKVLCKTNSVQNKHNLYHIDLNKLQVKLETVKDSTLVRLPPSEDTFKQHVLRSSYQTKIWLIAESPGVNPDWCGVKILFLSKKL
jgi:hypothetical protein